MKNQLGITLIELMIVVAVLAIISAIAIPAYRGYITTSHKAECQTEAAAIKLAQEEYFLQNNAYFDSSAGTTRADIQNASGNLYQGAAENYTNCIYTVTSTAATVYNITVTGTGALSGEGVILAFTKS